MQATINPTDPWPELARRLTAAHYSQVDLECDIEVSSAAKQYVNALQHCVATGALTLEQAIEDCESEIARGIQ